MQITCSQVLHKFLYLFNSQLRTLLLKFSTFPFPVNNMIIPQQFGFRKSYSTELALLHATEIICSFNENKKAALGEFLFTLAKPLTA